MNPQRILIESWKNLKRIPKESRKHPESILKASWKYPERILWESRNNSHRILMESWKNLKRNPHSIPKASRKHPERILWESRNDSHRILMESWRNPERILKKSKSCEENPARIFCLETKQKENGVEGTALMGGCHWSGSGQPIREAPYVNDMQTRCWRPLININANAWCMALVNQFLHSLPPPTDSPPRPSDEKFHPST